MLIVMLFLIAPPPDALQVPVELKTILVVPETVTPVVTDIEEVLRVLPVRTAVDDPLKVKVPPTVKLFENVKVCTEPPNTMLFQVIPFVEYVVDSDEVIVEPVVTTVPAVYVRVLLS